MLYRIFKFDWGKQAYSPWYDPQNPSWQQDTEYDGRWKWPFFAYPLAVQCLGEKRFAKSLQESHLIPSWSNFTGLWFKLFHVFSCKTSSGMNLFCLESLVNIQGRPLWLAKSKPCSSSCSHVQTQSLQLTFLTKHYLFFNQGLKPIISVFSLPVNNWTVSSVQNLEKGRATPGSPQVRGCASLPKPLPSIPQAVSTQLCAPQTEVRPLEPLLPRGAVEPFKWNLCEISL